MIEELKKKLGSRWITFERLHQIILSLNLNIGFRIFPCYISYFLGEKIIAVVYFRSKFISGAQLDVGLALKQKPKNSGFVDAEYMDYPEINYSIKISSKRDITKEFIKIAQLIFNK